MAYTKAELSGPVQLGDDKKRYYYDASDLSEAFGTVAASGYFNNLDDNLRFAVDDEIEVKASDGNGTLVVSAVSTGVVSVTVLDAANVFESVSTSQGISSYGTSLLAATGTYAMDTGPLASGQRKTLLNPTGAMVITSTGGAAVNTTGGALRLRVAAVSCELMAASTSRWLVVSASGATTTGAISGADILTS